MVNFEVYSGTFEMSKKLTFSYNQQFGGNAFLCAFKMLIYLSNKIELTWAAWCDGVGFCKNIRKKCRGLTSITENHSLTFDMTIFDV